MTENQKNMEIKKCLHKCPPKRRFSNGNHSLIGNNEYHGSINTH